jgi:galactokinase
VGEDARVPQALEAVRRADAALLGELALGSQRDADALLGNQIAETNALAELARVSGAFASCAFGAGFGGSVWALTASDEAEAFGARWLTAYLARFPQHTLASWFAARPGPALIEFTGA